MTKLDGGVSDEVYGLARAEFSETEWVFLTSAIGVINLWNRYGVAFRWTPAERPARAMT